MDAKEYAAVLSIPREHGESESHHRLRAMFMGDVAGRIGITTTQREFARWNKVAHAEADRVEAVAGFSARVCESAHEAFDRRIAESLGLLR